MRNRYIFQIEFPYWKDRRLLITLNKIFNKEKYVYRLGIWKLDRIRNDEWGTNWWKLFDIWKGKVI